MKLAVFPGVHGYQFWSHRASRALVLVAGMSVATACGGGAKDAEHPSTEPDPDALLAEEGPATVPASSPEVEQAMAAIEAEDYERAKSLLSPVIAGQPEDVQALFYLGVAEAGLGNADAALEQFEKTLELDPKFVDASLNLSALYLDLERFDEAAAAADQGLQHAPQDVALLQNKGLALSYSGQFEQASTVLKSVVEKKPDDEGLRFVLAEALFNSGDTEGAKKELSRLGASQSREVLASVADIHGRMKQWDQCIATLNAAIEKQSAAELLTRRGLCKHGKADEDGARADFEEAIKLEPNFAKAHFYLGHNLRERGNSKAAKAAFLKASELGTGKLAAAAKAAADKL